MSDVQPQKPGCSSSAITRADTGVPATDSWEDLHLHGSIWRTGLEPVPEFNHMRWGCSKDGEHPVPASSPAHPSDQGQYRDGLTQQRDMRPGLLSFRVLCVIPVACTCTHTGKRPSLMSSWTVSLFLSWVGAGCQGSHVSALGLP